MMYAANHEGYVDCKYILTFKSWLLKQLWSAMYFWERAVSLFLSLIQRLTAQKNQEKCFIKWRHGSSFSLFAIKFVFCFFFFREKSRGFQLPTSQFLSHLEPWNLIEIVKSVSVLCDWSFLQLECKWLFFWWWIIQFILLFVLLGL